LSAWAELSLTDAHNRRICTLTSRPLAGQQGLGAGRKALIKIDSSRMTKHHRISCNPSQEKFKEGMVHKHVHATSAVVKCMKLFAVALGLVAFVSSAAMAQTICNSQAVVNFPNGDNLNRVVGQSLQMSVTLINGPSLDAGAADSQTFSVVHFFP